MRWLIALCVAVTSGFAQPVWLHPKGGTPTFTNRLTILIVPEGFTQAELTGATWNITNNKTHASSWKNIAESIASGIIEGEPFKSYQQLFNIGYANVPSPSQQSGVTNGDTGTTVKTEFGIQYKGGSFQPITQPDTTQKLRDLAKSFSPKVPVDCFIVVVNSPEYGACTYAYDHGPTTGPGILVLPLRIGDATKPVREPKEGSEHPTNPAGQECDGWYTAQTGDFVIVAVHELGHALLGLADEYDDQEPKVVSVFTEKDEPTAANLTLETDPTKVKWKRWVDPRTGVGTPVESGFSKDKGIWHPRLHCRMNNHGCQFCPICKERAVQRFLAQVNLFDQVSPSGKRFDSEQVDTTFSVTFAPGFSEAQSSTNPLDVEWYVNNSPRKGDTTANGSSLVVKAAEFHAGPNNEIACVVSAKEVKATERPADFVPPDVTYRRDWKVNIRPAQQGVPNQLQGP